MTLNDQSIQNSSKGLCGERVKKVWYFFEATHAIDLILLKDRVENPRVN